MQLRSKRVQGPTHSAYTAGRKRLRTGSTWCTIDSINTFNNFSNSIFTINENFKFFQKKCKPDIESEENPHTLKKLSLSDCQEYTCVICLYIFQPKIAQLKCSHKFCYDCLQGYVSSGVESGQSSTNQKKCPICRLSFDPSEISIQFEDLDKLIVICDCLQQYPLTKMDEHKKSCPKVIQKIREKRFLVSPKHVPKFNRSTFSCTKCHEKNFDRCALINHYGSKHRHDSWGVCPMCKVMPWGNQYHERDVYSHLKRRHSFDYDNLVDFQFSEEQMLDQVILESLQSSSRRGSQVERAEGDIDDEPVFFMENSRRGSF